MFQVQLSVCSKTEKVGGLGHSLHQLGWNSVIENGKSISDRIDFRSCSSPETLLSKNTICHLVHMF